MTVTGIHSNSIVHDVATEEMFKYIQIFTAIINSFTHGANDVGMYYYLEFVLLYMMYIPSYEYISLINFIRIMPFWFRISMEIDFVTHCYLLCCNFYEVNIIIM
jgi:phosphate/sulfate permease